LSQSAVLILGCGYTGAQLAQRLTFRGIPVIGSTRNQQQASVIRTRGAEPLIFSADDVTPLTRFQGRVRRVVYMIPPQRDAAGSFADPVAGILNSLAGFDLEMFVYVSSTSVYGDKQGQLVTEETPCVPDSPRGEARVQAENKVLGSGFPACVVRPAGIYGPGRSMLHRIASGQYRLVGGGTAITNRIHVVDLATTIHRALHKGTAGSIYLASDERPTSQADVVKHVCERYGLSAPHNMPLEEARIRMTPSTLKMVTGSKRLDASWTRSVLGVTLRFPSFEEGCEAIWRQEGDVMTGSGPS
jgi:nucleoside-diphosphate-sugar epimerase